MDRATFNRESAINRDAYQTLRDRIRKDFSNQYVALAHGQLVGVANTFDSACDLVRSLSPLPECYFVFPGHMEPNFDLDYDLTSSD